MSENPSYKFSDSVSLKCLRCLPYTSPGTRSIISRYLLVFCFRLFNPFFKFFCFHSLLERTASEKARAQTEAEKLVNLTDFFFVVRLLSADAQWSRSTTIANQWTNYVRNKNKNHCRRFYEFSNTHTWNDSDLLLHINSLFSMNASE